MCQIRRDEIIDSIVKLTKSINIKSFTNGDTLIDFRNISELDRDLPISISNKYIPLLDYSIGDLQEFFTHDNNMNVVTYKEKFISFIMTNHAVEKFLKRFIYIYLMGDKFEFSVKMKRLYTSEFDAVSSILLEMDEDTKLNENIDAMNIVREVLMGSELFHTGNSGRHRDIKAFNKRDLEYGDTLRYFNHPFMFVVENGVCKTVELYSSSQDCRHLNKHTSNSKRFMRWLRERLDINDGEVR